MSTPISGLLRLKRAALRGAFALPFPVQRMLAGRTVIVDDQELAVEAKLLLRFLRLDGRDELWAGSVADSRAAIDESAQIVDGKPVPVERLETAVPGPRGRLPARLYTPVALAPGSGLMVFFHGGGWVIGNLRTHDALCAYLAHSAQVRVLSVDYRLAPEHPFPAAVDDARASYDHAVRVAESLGADPEAVAVGGDSAGANLAAVVAASPDRQPAFALLLYPRVDFSARRRSHDLFRSGYFLTARSIENFEKLYVDAEHESDPRASVLLTTDLARFPATYLSTAGFDPLRDEGEAFAARLADAGVPVVLSRQLDLIHGYASLFALGGRFEQATAEAADALRTALALRQQTQPEGTQPSPPRHTPPTPC
ncbi:alpha/beta hydrolase [Kribbella sp. NPDC049584]|uniref:alpha/beta hydrolase n=1 Tax=Kribbella sp. NPDC049584 TaxID=3154833 RepID=UPI003419E1DC